MKGAVWLRHFRMCDCKDRDKNNSPCKPLGSCAKNSFTVGSHRMGYTCTWSLLPLCSGGLNILLYAAREASVHMYFSEHGP